MSVCVYTTTFGSSRLLKNVSSSSAVKFMGNNPEISEATKIFIQELFEQCYYGLSSQYLATSSNMVFTHDQIGQKLKVTGFDWDTPSPIGTCNPQVVWAYLQLKKRGLNCGIALGQRKPFFEGDGEAHYFIVVPSTSQYVPIPNDDLLSPKIINVPDSWYIIDPSFKLQGLAADLSRHRYKIKTWVTPDKLAKLRNIVGYVLKNTQSLPVCSGVDLKGAIQSLVNLDYSNLARSSQQSNSATYIDQLRGKMNYIQDNALIFMVVQKNGPLNLGVCIGYKNPSDTKMKYLPSLFALVKCVAPLLGENGNGNHVLHFLQDLLPIAVIE
jgi:hypothetical protein